MAVCAVYTVPDRRRRHLALACARFLCADIEARGHVVSDRLSA
ncbi:hypothetical protein ACIPSA_33275 [Streptomyces sp. NPDC086549]